MLYRCTTTQDSLNLKNEVDLKSEDYMGVTCQQAYSTGNHSAQSSLRSKISVGQRLRRTISFLMLLNSGEMSLLIFDTLSDEITCGEVGFLGLLLLIVLFTEVGLLNFLLLLVIAV